MKSLRLQRENGVVLITSLIFLMILTMLGVTLLSTTSMEERMAFNSQEIAKSLQIADSGIQKMHTDGRVFVYGHTYCIPTDCSGYDNDSVDGSEYGNTGFGVKYKKTAGVIFPVGRSDNPALLWDASKFSRYYFDLGVKTTNLKSKTRKTVNSGAMGIAKSTN